MIAERGAGTDTILAIEDQRNFVAPSPVSGAPSDEPKLVLALPDYETRRIVIASDEVIDGERLVCVAIKGAAPVAEVAARPDLAMTYQVKRSAIITSLTVP
jgi:hypothetical protein